jgi:two-component system NtrC family sensor kinase
MLKTINAKLIVSIGLITLLIFGIFSYVFVSQQNKQLINEVFRGASIFSDTVTRSTRYDMLIADREGVHRMIESIGNQAGVEVVRVFNKEGKIMFSTNKKEMNNYVDKNAEACYICHAAERPLERLSTSERSRIFPGKKHRILAMITPIYNEPDCYNASCHAHSQEQRVLGVLDIGMSLAEVDNELKRNQAISIFFTLIAILGISSILTLYIHRLVTKPVKQLVNATKTVALGNLDVELPRRTRDEIGQLAVSFNHMIQDLKKAKEKIQAWNIELENKVEERTQKLRMAREQLVQSEKMASMGVLASSVAHEINNPLQGILTYIKLMLRILSGENVDQKKLKDFENYLQLMGNEIQRCGDMVKNLLVFSKQSKLKIQEANINDIIKNSLLLVENKVKIQNIKVVLNLIEKIPLIYCDVKQIQQTLIAMVINSIEAMPQGGEIDITTRDIEGKQVEITIADTGEGIPRENLKNIFDPFFTTKEAVKSTGLGLFVSYGIIKEHKGTIAVESESGQGTAFHIRLPVKNAG